MKLLRTLSTARLIGLVVLVATVGAAGAALALAAGGGGTPPPPKPLATAIHDALSGSTPAGITARITFTNNLFPSGALTGVASSALLSGATGRLWVTADGKGRLELTSSAGDTQIVWASDKAWAYDASTNTVYKLNLPASTSSDAHDAATPPALADVQKILTELSQQATVSGADPGTQASEPAYTVTISPKHDGGLLGSAQLAFDATNGVPLRIAVYAQGSATPALALTVTDISFDAVAAGTVDITPPPGAHIVDLGAAAKSAGPSDRSSGPDVNTLAGVQAAVDFPVAAPDTLVGLPRQHVGLAGKDAAIVVYGQGLGAIVVVERKADSTQKAGAFAGVPTVSLDGVTAHELATQLGTVIEWQSAGRGVVLAGSLPAGAAEAAAREVK